MNKRLLQQGYIPELNTQALLKRVKVNGLLSHTVVQKGSVGRTPVIRSVDHGIARLLCQAPVQFIVN